MELTSPPAVHSARADQICRCPVSTLMRSTGKMPKTVVPVVMMNAVMKLTKQYGLKTIVSLNSIMVDGTGMCGGCRITYDGKTHFVCVDGPEFDASLVDWEELIKRNRIYDDKEKHICKLNITQK